MAHLGFYEQGPHREAARFEGRRPRSGSPNVVVKKIVFEGWPRSSLDASVTADTCSTARDVRQAYIRKKTIDLSSLVVVQSIAALLKCRWRIFIVRHHTDARY